MLCCELMCMSAGHWVIVVGIAWPTLNLQLFLSLLMIRNNTEHLEVKRFFYYYHY